MKRISYCWVFILMLSINLAAQDDVSQAKWQTSKIITDGSNDEWNKPLNLYDGNTGLLFAITNDSKVLNICFTGNDERKISKLMKAGWSIELSSKEKKKKFSTSIVFPAVEMISAPGKNDDLIKSARPDFKNITAMYKLDLRGVKTSGFVNANGDIPLLNNDGINIGVGSDSTQAIIFELAIPFKELLPEDKLQFNEEMTLEVTVNALKKPAATGNENSAGRGSYGGGGGRMGGGAGRMGGGRRGGGGSGAERSNSDAAERNLLFEKISFKQKFRLAKQ
jgi:uncharacterized membrane protein YgcG